MGIVCALPARAELVSKMVEYKQGDTTLEGYLVYDNVIQGKRPGVLVVHEWWGLNDYPKQRADQLAQLGYVAFALDMYGKGVVAKDRSEAGKLAGQFKGKPIIRERAKAGFDVLAAQELVDPKRIAAIGYCFGGTTVLELAYSGAPLAGIVSFHGGMVSPKPEDDTHIHAKVLVCHGADDPHVPGDDIEAFAAAMKRAGADWQLIAYGDAVHAFTNPKAGSDKSSGVAYNQKADERSWKHMKTFFDEIFQ
jgi:dienelactone hydrolase